MDCDFDSTFRQAVCAIDEGDLTALEHLLQRHPEVVARRLEQPGQWLRDEIGSALDTFFRSPYLLWFVSEDAVRKGSLPDNIADIASLLIRSIRQHAPDTFQEQLYYGLRLVAWSSVANKATALPQLLDSFIDAGASTNRVAEDALVNGNYRAAEHLIARGATLTLPVAGCLCPYDSLAGLAEAATEREKQFALVLAALNGKSEGVKALLLHGADPNKRSEDLYSHASPLHHAVCSGSLPTVQLFVDAGADRNAKDDAWGGTPYDWAEYSVRQRGTPEFREIAAYLKGLSLPPSYGPLSGSFCRSIRTEK